MTTTHKPLTWFAGDDWEIRATLIDEDGAPFDLSGTPEIKWVLISSAHAIVLDEDDTVVTITDAAAGKCTILVSAVETSPLAGGHYQDAIRIVTGGVTSTLSTGPIYVAADPWKATAVTRLRRVV